MKALSKIAEPQVDEQDEMSVLMKASVVGSPKEEHSHLPVSYTSVQESMKHSLMVNASIDADNNNEVGSMSAYQFWARCTLLVAAAILKATET